MTVSPRGSRCRATMARTRSSPCRNGSCGSERTHLWSPSSSQVPRTAAGPERPFGHRRRRHRARLPVEPRDLDRTDPGRPGDPRGVDRERDRVVGVSPIMSGAPVKGPADRLMGPLGIEVSCVGVARTYAEFCGTLVIDAGGRAPAGEVERDRSAVPGRRHPHDRCTGRRRAGPAHARRRRMTTASTSCQSSASARSLPETRSARSSPRPRPRRERPSSPPIVWS